MKNTYQKKFKKPFLAGFLTLLCAGALLTLGRWASVANEDIVIINAVIHSHISNLSLSLISYLGIGGSWLLSGVKFRFITILGAVLIGGNFICETVMDFMNTTDIIDAVYGTAGCAAAWLFLLLTNKYGLLGKNAPGP